MKDWLHQAHVKREFKYLPPKHSFAHTIGYLKGKSAVRLHRDILETKGTLFSRSFRSRGYCVSIVGLDEAGILAYSKHQEKRRKEKAQAGLEFD